MPDQLTPATRARTFALCALVVVAFAGCGALAGVVWHAWWEAPTGVVARGDWFPLPPETGQRADFDGVAHYVVVALAAGFLLGLGVALATRGREVAVLLAIVLGALLGGWLMASVGTALSPDDPEVLARAAEDGARLPGHLRVPEWSPYTMMPIGALLGVVVCYLLAPTTRGDGSGDAGADQPTAPAGTADDAGRERD